MFWHSKDAAGSGGLRVACSGIRKTQEQVVMTFYNTPMQRIWARNNYNIMQHDFQPSLDSGKLAMMISERPGRGNRSFIPSNK